MAANMNEVGNTTYGADHERSSFGNKSKLGGVAAKANQLIGKGTDTLRQQYQVVREQGVQGVKNDVVGYAKREPMKALLLAGGIGALAAMILRRR